MDRSEEKGTHANRFTTTNLQCPAVKKSIGMLSTEMGNCLCW